MRRARVGFLVVAVTLAAVLACKDHEKTPVQPAAPTAKTYASNPSWVETKVDVFPGMDGPNLNLDADDIRLRWMARDDQGRRWNGRDDGRPCASGR